MSTSCSGELIKTTAFFSSFLHIFLYFTKKMGDTNQRCYIDIHCNMLAMVDIFLSVTGKVVPFFNQQNGENNCRKYVMMNLHKSYAGELGLELVTNGPNFSVRHVLWNAEKDLQQATVNVSKRQLFYNMIIFWWYQQVLWYFMMVA